MRRSTLSLSTGLLLLLAAPAMAQTASEQREIRKAWGDYLTLTSNAAPGSLDTYSASSFKHFEFLRDAALYASADQMRRLPVLDRLVVYSFRALYTASQLQAMNGRAALDACQKFDLCGATEGAGKDAGMSLRTVTLVAGDRAVGELGPPTEQSFQYGPSLQREAGHWRVDYRSLVPDASTHAENKMRESGVGFDQVLQSMLAKRSPNGDAPERVLLDTAPLDDAAARNRLNQAWPDYQRAMRDRLQATERKAEAGDTLAQLGLGAFLYAGVDTKLVPQDKKRGLALMRQASDNGNTRAASLVMDALMQEATAMRGKVVPKAHWNDVATYTKRAAETGNGQAMALYSSLLFYGAGDLPRSCRQAYEWAQRAEDAGWEHARNDRVWQMATCPLAEERDPAAALQAAKQMQQQSSELSAAELDTVAAAYAVNGRWNEALSLQQRALDALKKDDSLWLRLRLQRRLTDYKARKPHFETANQYAQPMP